MPPHLCGKAPPAEAPRAPPGPAPGGGAGLVITEAAAVEARGRISPADLGIWKDEHIEPLARVSRFIQSQGAVPGIQLAHAGRKASTARPWEGGKPVPPEQGGWTPVAPSPIPFAPSYPRPIELSIDEIHRIEQAFADAARRAIEAGFGWIEIHAAHGYLAHSFLSPLSNHRTDNYGGSFDNRARFVLETAGAVGKVWGEDRPLAVRLSCTDWAEGGWDLEQSIELAKRLKSLAIDLIDCSSGGMVPNAKIPAEPGYQVPFAEAIRRQAGIATAAVGLITQPPRADEIIHSGQADLVLLARQSLREPYWPARAWRELHLGEKPPTPPQYARAW